MRVENTSHWRTALVKSEEWENSAPPKKILHLNLSGSNGLGQVLTFRRSTGLHHVVATSVLCEYVCNHRYKIYVHIFSHWVSMCFKQWLCTVIYTVHACNGGQHANCTHGNYDEFVSKKNNNKKQNKTEPVLARWLIFWTRLVLDRNTRPELHLTGNHLYSWVQNQGVE